jgi:peptidyl-prolyl cis-trans isomerase B (cyclophilin B)
MIKLQTNRGSITIDLDSEKAPETAANFLAYVESGHYDGTIFHRVIDGFMIQGGGFTPDMQQKETRAPIKNEWTWSTKSRACAPETRASTRTYRTKT